MEGLNKLYRGDFNDMLQERQPDGTVVITLSKRGEGKTYRFRVKDLYGKDETVLEHKVIKTKAPGLIRRRMKEANKYAGQS